MDPGTGRPATPQSLAEALVERVVDHLEMLVGRYVPDWRVPRAFAGHRVGEDVRADLAFTLGFLHDLGVTEVSGTAIPDAISRVLRPIDGRGTHTFYSYRVAETLARFGVFDECPITSGWADREIGSLAEATDTTSWVEYLDGGHLPRNYAAVLARCELARDRLGLDVDDVLFERLAQQTADMLDANPLGFLDDSQTRIGRYDIYTADVYLFTEPLAGHLGPTWRRGIAAALDLAERVSSTDGSAITWGRSTGVLSVCLTLELAGLAVGEGLTEDPGPWLARGQRAFERLDTWMNGGLVNAHQHRSTYAYRGPQRRIQMTLDCLGKLADAALHFRRSPGDLVASSLDEAFPDRDELIVLDGERHAAIWTHRSSDIAFVLPLVGPTVSDYLAAPRNPGVFEVPVDAPLASGVPVAWRGFGHYVGGGLPQSVVKTERGVIAEYDGFPVINELERRDDANPLPGSRRVEYTIDGRILQVEERLHFEKVPDAVGLQIAETANRRLRVEFDSDRPHVATTIDTDGLAEYRSFWSELPRVHQIDVEPARDITIRWSASPIRRVAASERQQHYMRAIYDPIADRADVVQLPRELVTDTAGMSAFLDSIDLYHQHWPEWLTVQDPEVHRRFIRLLVRRDIRVLWTQHNLVPHAKNDLGEIYDLWADAADGVVHHSHWGMEQARSRYSFRPDAEHRIIPHPHWGHAMRDLDAIDRSEVERTLGLRACAVRLGVIGAPRAEKDVQCVIDAVHRSARDDVGLVVACLREESAPDDPRIVAHEYKFTSRRRYNELLSAVDVIVLPFAPDGMLTTGVVGDVVGAGLPAIVSPWPYLAEVLGDAGIPYDGSVGSLTDLIDGLDQSRLRRAASAARSLRARYDRNVVAEAHLAFMEDLGVGLTRR